MQNKHAVFPVKDVKIVQKTKVKLKYNIKVYTFLVSKFQHCVTVQT